RGGESLWRETTTSRKRTRTSERQVNKKRITRLTKVGMGYRRGGAPRVRAGTDRDESGAGTSGATVHTGAGSALASEYDGAAAPGEGGYFRESPRKARKKRVWLRAVFCVFLVAEIVIAFVVEEYS
ncbi:unnamed protein product, partial [Laminaria digitata]